MLLALLLLPCAEVFGATYDHQWSIIAGGDPEHEIADIQVTYSTPDKVKVGGTFETYFSLTYVKNENAYCAWLEFYEVGLRIRESPLGADLAWVIMNNRMRLRPGEQWTDRLSFNPGEMRPGEYFVILTWKTLHPETKAYGLAIDSKEITWDTGGGKVKSWFIKMTVETDYTSTYVALGVVGIGGLLAIFALVVWRNRKAAIPRTQPVTPEHVAYCGHCGAQMPLEATLCPRCGAEQ